MIETLVIFDWSGILSPDAVRFGEDENLKRELERNGLAALGIPPLPITQRRSCGVSRKSFPLRLRTTGCVPGPRVLSTATRLLTR